MHEKRCCSRKKVADPIQAVDSNTLEPLGILANISANGFMLIGNKQIEPSRVYQLLLNFAEQVDGVKAIECGAESLWADSAADDGMFWTGFQIIDISDDDAEFISEKFNLTES
jgi:hypothetical protein